MIFRLMPQNNSIMINDYIGFNSVIKLNRVDNLLFLLPNNKVTYTRNFILCKII